MASNSEKTIRPQADGKKRTASLGSALNQGGDYHESSADDLAEIMGQGDVPKKTQSLGFGSILGQGSKR